MPLESMNIPTDSFKINLNQNLWGLIASYCGLGLAEHYHLPTLYWLALLASIAMTISVVVTAAVYTHKYCSNKLS